MKQKTGTVSLWDFLNSQADLYRNVFFQPPEGLLLPSHSISHLVFWSDFFLQDNHGHEAFMDRRGDCLRQASRWQEEAAQLRAELSFLKQTLQSGAGAFGKHEMMIDLAFQPIQAPNPSKDTEAIEATVVVQVSSFEEEVL